MSGHNDGVQAAWRAPADQPIDGASYRAAFDFVQALAAELSRGVVDLPAYPDVAIRVRHVLAEDHVTSDRIARVIAADAGLAARMLSLANSAALSRGGKPQTDLRLAITRVGHDTVRSAALAYALQQIRAAESLGHIRDDLARLWQRSTLVAATARVLAVRTHAAGADEALLAGLLHNVGCVYILARADAHASFLADAAVRDAVMQEWHAHVGKAIAQNWGLSEHVADAIGEQDTVDRLEAGRRDLVDVLFVAVRAAECDGQPDGLALLADLPAFRRLALDEHALLDALRDSAAEIAGLRSALGQ